jgi:hypothetical protein
VLEVHVKVGGTPLPAKRGMMQDITAKKRARAAEGGGSAERPRADSDGEDEAEEEEEEEEDEEQGGGDTRTRGSSGRNSRGGGRSHGGKPAKGPNAADVFTSICKARAELCAATSAPR